MNILTDKVFVPVVEQGNLIVHSFTALIKLLLKMVMSTAIMANFSGSDQTISFNFVTAITTQVVQVNVACVQM